MTPRLRPASGGPAHTLLLVRPARRVGGRGATTIVILVVLALALALTGCGAGGGVPAPAAPTASPSSSTPSASGPSTTASGPARLTIAVTDGTATVSTWHLTCSPDGGDHPDPHAACRVLARNGARALPPVGRGRACTQIYGGPATALVTGSWRGERVSSRLNLVNGCEASRWQALLGLLPKVAGAR